METWSKGRRTVKIQGQLVLSFTPEERFAVETSPHIVDHTRGALRILGYERAGGEETVIRRMA